MPALRSGARRLRSSNRGRGAASPPARPSPSRKARSSPRVASTASRQGRTSNARRSSRKQQKDSEQESGDDEDEDEENEKEEEEDEEEEVAPARRSRRSLSKPTRSTRRQSQHQDNEDKGEGSSRNVRQTRNSRARYQEENPLPAETLSPVAARPRFVQTRRMQLPRPGEIGRRRSPPKELRRTRLTGIPQKAQHISESSSDESEEEVRPSTNGRALRSRTSIAQAPASARQTSESSSRRLGPPGRRRSARFASAEEMPVPPVRLRPKAGTASRPQRRTSMRLAVASESEEENSSDQTEGAQESDAIAISSDEDDVEDSLPALGRSTRSLRSSASTSNNRNGQSPRPRRRSGRQSSGRTRSGARAPQRVSSRTTQKRSRLNIIDTAPDEEEDEADDDEDDGEDEDKEEDEDEDDADGDDDEDPTVSEPTRRPSARATRANGRRLLEVLEMSSDSSETSNTDVDDEQETLSGYSSWTDEDIPIAQALDIEPGLNDRIHSIELSDLTNEERELAASLQIFGSQSQSVSQAITSSFGRRVTKRKRLGFESSDDDKEAPLLYGARRTTRPKAPVSTASSDGSGSDESSASPLVDSAQQPVRQRHWETCGRCGERPAWMQIISLKRTQNRLDRERAKQMDRYRPTRKELKGRRSTGHYDVGHFEELHALGTAQAQLDEKRRLLGETGAWLVCYSCSQSVHTGCQGDDRNGELLHTINVEKAARHKAFARPGKAKIRLQFSPADYLSSVECERCYTTISRCHVCEQDCTPAVPDEDDDKGESPCFRCKRCFRTAHYECLQQLSGEDELDEAALARQKAGWKCIDCDAWGDVEVILAWRPQADTESEPRSQYHLLRKPSDDLKRDYLVKFKNLSFRETQWVPHHWLSLVAEGQLRYFLAHGTRLELEPISEQGPGLVTPPLPPVGLPPSQFSQRTANTPRRSKRQRLLLTAHRETGEVLRGPPAPEAGAQGRIPKTWVTPDRILDVYFHINSTAPSDLKPLTKAELRRLRRRPRQITKEGHGADIADEKSRLELSPDYVHISQVDEYFLESIAETEMEALMPTAKILVKWDDLEYEQSTWEHGASPSEYSDEWLSLVLAFQRYMSSRKVYVKHMSSRQMVALEAQRKKAKFQSIAEQPDYVVGGRMLDFQIDGLNWLRYGWHDHQPGILADEMGLGKTVQVVAFIASLHQQFDGLGPYLVVVPNSVVTNWVREFEKWCPHLRVVPYYGGRESRGIIERFELFHLESMPGRQDLRAEVVICSDSVARSDPAPLKRVQRWQAVIVDEGTNLKAGSGTLLYRRLAALETAHRLIMTGTPLNNNIGELFNLLNWLKPNAEWKDVKGLHKKYAVLTPELIAELQPLLKPYFLRRLKKDVVDLPPRSEVLVPISLTPLQKRVYKDVLEKNIEDIQALTDVRSLSKRDHKYKIGNMMNILMQLRKACQHPYLIAPSLETFEGDEGHDWRLEAERLVEASCKLKVLQKLLPQLKAKGRRVLIFSQFVIFLDIVESLLLNEGKYKYLRLDGSFGHRQRQRGISAFNAPGSDYFCYLLSTRAGGVGINLASADTVIILDSDFNPHLDMQAIARAHRIGQTRKVIVFTLVAKSTAEEQIVNNARKKLILDHVIHTMDDEESREGSLQDALQFGARALFQEGGVDQSEKDVDLSEQDITALIEEAEQADDASASASQGGEAGAGNLLSFARVWERDEQADPTADMADDGFWTALLAKTRAADPANESGAGAGQAEEVVYGRGGARRAKLIALAGGASTEDIDAELDEDAARNDPGISTGAAGQADAPMDFGDDAGDNDWTMDLGVPEMTSASDHGSTSIDEVERAQAQQQQQQQQQHQQQPGKRPRGRPRKYPRPMPLPVAGPSTAVPPPAQPPAPPAAPALSIFDTTSRSLPKPPRAPKQPRKAKENRTANGEPSVASAGPSTSQGTSNQTHGPTGPVTLYTRLAVIKDPAEAMALCVAAYPGQPDTINQVYNAWVGVMLGASVRQHVASQGGPSLAAGPSRSSAATASSVQATTGGAVPSTPATQRKKTATAADRGGRAAAGSSSQATAAGPPLPGQVQTAIPDGTASPARKRGRPKKVRPEAPPVTAAQGPPAAPVPARQPAAAPQRPGIAGFQQPGQPPLAQQPSILEQQQASGFMEVTRTPAELKKMFKDVPEHFMTDVKMRQAQGLPKSLLVPEQRSQLTKTHMAYFSLRLLNFLGGIHPLFHDAFSLVQSEHVPPRIRAQPFEGAEMLSISVVTERLSETAHYFYNQSLNQGKKSTAGRPSSGASKRQASPSGRRSGQHAAKPSTMSVNHVLNGQASMERADAASGSQRARQRVQQDPAPALQQAVQQRNRSTMAPPALAIVANQNQHRSSPTSATLSIDSQGHGSTLQQQQQQQQRNNNQPTASISTISPTALPPEGSTESERLAFFWLQAIDALSLPGMSKASRMWLLQPIGPERDVMGQEINARLAEILTSRRRLGQPVPHFFRQSGDGGAAGSGFSGSSSAGAGGMSYGETQRYMDQSFHHQQQQQQQQQQDHNAFARRSAYQSNLGHSHNAGWPGGA